MKAWLPFQNPLKNLLKSILYPIPHFLKARRSSNNGNIISLTNFARLVIGTQDFHRWPNKYSIFFSSNGIYKKNKRDERRLKLAEKGRKYLHAEYLAL